MPRNPSELARLEAEREELIEAIVSRTRPKSVKEAMLRELRAIERQLGVKGRPYNSSAFGGPDGENAR